MAGRVRVVVDADAIVFDKKILKQTLRVAGNELKQKIKSELQQTFGSGRFYYGPGGSAKKYRGGYQKTRYQASAPGQAPVSVTGTLARSLSVRLAKSGQTVLVRDNAFYALMLERGAVGGGQYGGKGQAKRSAGNLRKRGQIVRVGSARQLAGRYFMENALDQMEGSLLPRIRQAARDGVKLQRMKLK